MKLFINKDISTSDEADFRNNNFNSIRFFAAIMVILGHMYLIIGSPGLNIFNQDISTIGVKIFFLISGYLITESYMRDSNIIRYAIRRFFRIIPGLSFLVVLTVFILGPLLTSLSIHEYFSNSITYSYLKNIVLYIQYGLPGIFQFNIYPNAVNGSLWSLPAEVLMYIVVPIVLFISKQVKHPIIVICTFILMLVSINSIVYKFNPQAFYVVYATNIFDALHLAPYFFIGTLFTFTCIKKILNVQLATAMLFVAMTCNFSYIPNEILMYVVLSYFIFSFALAQRPVFGNWFAKNDYSYGIYLYGFLVQQMSVNLLSKYNLRYNHYVIISIIGSFIFAFISWHLIEKPAQKLCKTILIKLRK